MKKKRFSDEQLQRASGIDIVAMLQGQGEKLKKQGRVYRWLRYDSTVIDRNRWYRHSREIGGGPIQFMQHGIINSGIRWKMEIKFHHFRSKIMQIHII